MTDALQGAAYERKRRFKAKEPVDGPYYITDAQARDVARQSAALSVSIGANSERDCYQSILGGESTLYGMKLVVRER